MQHLHFYKSLSGTDSKNRTSFLKIMTRGKARPLNANDLTVSYRRSVIVKAHLREITFQKTAAFLSSVPHKNNS